MATQDSLAQERAEFVEGMNRALKFGLLLLFGLLAFFAFVLLPFGYSVMNAKRIEYETQIGVTWRGSLVTNPGMDTNSGYGLVTRPPERLFGDVGVTALHKTGVAGDIIVLVPFSTTHKGDHILYDIRDTPDTRLRIDVRFLK